MGLQDEYDHVVEEPLLGGVAAAGAVDSLPSLAFLLFVLAGSGGCGVAAVLGLEDGVQVVSRWRPLVVNLVVVFLDRPVVNSDLHWRGSAAVHYGVVGVPAAAAAGAVGGWRVLEAVEAYQVGSAAVVGGLGGQLAVRTPRAATQIALGARWLLRVAGLILLVTLRMESGQFGAELGEEFSVYLQGCWGWW